ncbi:MAG: hypothetical protein J4N32_03790 [Chloroflexi bacterium]|nr:hypothetical protein [Chloroflexota bacterium]
MAALTRTRTALAAGALLLAVAAACGAQPEPPPRPTATAPPALTSASTPTAAGAATPGWRTDLEAAGRVGNAAPNVTVTLTDGTTATLEELAGGKPLLLYFFATW